VDLIQHSGEVLILVRVVPPNACPATVLSAREYLHTRAAELEDAGLHVITRVLCGEPAAGIVASTREDRADLAVMVTHARTGPDRWLHGSVAETVIRGSPAPVLLLRANSDKAPEPLPKTPNDPRAA